MIAIIDYGMGNIGSVKNAVEYLGYDVMVPKEQEDLNSASHIILPGVGAFSDGMKNLTDLGLIEILKKEVLENHKPFLGLCLGMQLLATFGEEGGPSQGLGWIKGEVKRLDLDETKFKIPHMGWNDVFPKKDSILFKGIQRPIFYFVHSYHFITSEKRVISAEVEYGMRLVAAVEHNNIFGLQFHTEKSQQEGLNVLNNFLCYSS